MGLSILIQGRRARRVDYSAISTLRLSLIEQRNASFFTLALSTKQGGILVAIALAGSTDMLGWLIFVSSGFAVAVSGAAMAWSFNPLRTPDRADIASVLEVLAPAGA